MNRAVRWLIEKQWKTGCGGVWGKWLVWMKWYVMSNLWLGCVLNNSSDFDNTVEENNVTRTSISQVWQMWKLQISIIFEPRNWMNVFHNAKMASAPESWVDHYVTLSRRLLHAWYIKTSIWAKCWWIFHHGLIWATSLLNEKKILSSGRSGNLILGVFRTMME